MSEVRRVLLANGQYIEIVQETGTSTGSVMSQNAVTTALNSKANTTHTHAASDITSGTFGSARIDDGAITSVKIATNAVTTAKVADGAITRAKLASDVPISVTQYETVTVTGVCSDVSSIAGKQLTIGGYLCEFDSNGVVSANIPYGQAYTIRPIASNLYVGDNSYAFTASTASRSVTMNYSLIGYGVYIEDRQGKVYTTANWSSGNNANANSVVVITDAHSFRIALQGLSSRMTMSANRTDPWETYLTGTTDSTAAKADYNGAVNTQNIITKCQSATTYAAGWCNAYTFPDGVTKGYLPAFGEWYLAYQNKDAIDAALTKCGGASLTVSGLWYWSSTFWGISGDARCVWGLGWSGGSGFVNLTDGNVVRAFGAYAR